MEAIFVQEIRETLAKSPFSFVESAWENCVIFEEQSTREHPIRVIAQRMAATTWLQAEQEAQRLQALVESKRAEDQRTGLCRETMIIPEDRWYTAGKAYRARLMAHLGIFRHVYARNCEIRRVDKLTAATFLSDHHSYGFAQAKHFYGCYIRRQSGACERASKLKPGTLVAVAAFSGPRRWEKEGRRVASCEWVRYASLSGVRVIGGMGKLLEAFVRDQRPDDVMSYADLEWSEGRVYRSLGFVEESRRAPVSFRIDPLTYQRSPVPDDAKGESAVSEDYCYCNLGSIKYRKSF